MKKALKLFLFSCLLFLLLLFIGYFLLAYYYREGFSINTWINGIYCTGKTVQEVNEELLSGMEAPSVVITDHDGTEYSLDMADMGYRADYTRTLNSYIEEQRPLLWVDHVVFHSEHTVIPEVTYNEELLHKAFAELPPIQRELQRKEAYELKYSVETGYYLYDGLSDRMDTEKAFAALKVSITEGMYHLDLSQLDCYFDLPLTEEQLETKELAEKLEHFARFNIVYDMGDQMLPLDAATLHRFVKTDMAEHNDEPGIILDEKGNLVLDEAAVTNFVASLAEEYDTYGKEREFQSTRGDVVTVKGVTYGTEIDQKAEVSYLLEKLSSASQTEEVQYHIPAYKREGIVRGRNDIGDTYIEIDMTEQMMYYYEAGELMLETEVVTGNTGRRWGTPEGVNYVYNKQKNRILRGKGYASPVKYWMPVKGSIGIHDASWRNKFGGTIYQTNGSHGCINTPSEKMAELYEMVEIGTPVILFY